MSKYYVLSRSWSRSPARTIDRSTCDRQGRWWDDGCRFDTAVKVPIEMKLTPYVPDSPDQSRALPAFIDGVVPLMSTALVAALQAMGVANLELYSAVLIDPDDGSRHEGYWAFNLIGLVAAAEMAASIYTVRDGIPLIDVAFDKLVIDPNKCAGLRMFRLAENNSAIIVHESVRDRLLEDGFGELTFYKPENIAI
jgi:hypothetical protein